MALYHFHVAQIRRSKGHTAIAAAAYRSGQKLYDDYYGEIQDYTQKDGVILEEILLPEHAPDRLADRQTLWTEVEYQEKHPHAQLAYSFDVALQNELSIEENIALAREFIQTNFVAKGMICDWAVHKSDKGKGGIENPHFHVLVPIRPLKGNGEWDAKQHRQYVLDDHGERIRNEKGRYVFQTAPTTDWGRPETLEQWRKNWAKLVNSRFEQKGIDCRIDHRSYEERGLDLVPQVHEGAAVCHMEKKGISTARGEWNRWVKQTYQALHRIRAVLEELSSWIASTKKELQKERAPDVVMLVNEYFDHRNRVADTYERGRQKAKSTNLKRYTEICNYLMKHNIRTVEDLERRITDKEHEAREIEGAVKPLRSELDGLKEQMKRLKDYRRYLPIYETSQKIFFKGRKKAYQDEHRKELNRFQKAKRELLKTIPESSLEHIENAWQSRIEGLSREIADTFSEMRKEQLDQEIKELRLIRSAVDFALERRGINTTDSSEKLRKTEYISPIQKREKVEVDTQTIERNRSSLRERLAEKKEIVDRSAQASAVERRDIHKIEPSL